MGQHSGYNLEKKSEHDRALMMQLIFLRLPVNILMRFQCVSSYWLHWINSQECMSLYLQENMTNNNNRHVFVSSRRLGQKIINRLLSVDETTNQELQEVYSERFKKNYEIVGSCNGIICLYCDVEFKLALWNPFMRKYRMLPMVKVNKIIQEKQEWSYGFGYHKEGNDYKVVQIIQSYEQGNLLGTKVKVYSFILNSWTEVEDLPFVGSDFSKNGCFLNGALHWLALNRPTAKHLLLRFKLGLEKFDQLEVPIVDNNADLKLGVLGDCLSMCESKEDLAVIWVLKTTEPCGWIRQHLVRLQDPDQASYLKITPLAYTNKGKKLLLAVGFNTFIWYDLKNNEEKVFFLPQYTESLEVVMCIESLVPLGVDSKADL